MGESLGAKRVGSLREKTLWWSSMLKLMCVATARSVTVSSAEVGSGEVARMGRCEEEIERRRLNSGSSSSDCVGWVAIIADCICVEWRCL